MFRYLAQYGDPVWTSYIMDQKVRGNGSRLVVLCTASYNRSSDGGLVTDNEGVQRGVEDKVTVCGIHLMPVLERHGWRR